MVLVQPLTRSLQDLGFPTIRALRTIYLDEILKTYYWIELEEGEFYKLPIEVDQHIDIRFGEKYCSICRERFADLERGICINCLDDKDPFNTRLSCLFGRQNSPLQLIGCSKKQPTCGFQQNVRYCHRPYVIYLGRIGNVVKVGISRKSRRGGYMARLVEQGLNEAYVISEFENLETALQCEQDLKSMGFGDRIYFDQKIGSMFTEPIYPLTGDWSKEMIESYFAEKEIEYYILYDDFHITGELCSGLEDRIQGTIIHMQGPVLLTQFDGAYYFWNLKKYLHRQIIHGEVDEILLH